MKFNFYVLVLFVILSVVERSLTQNECCGTVNYDITIGGGACAAGDDDCDCADLERRLELLERQNYTRPQAWPKDCAEYLELGFDTSGVYTVTLQVPDALLTSFQSRPSFDVVVYCDMETDGGGWTVFQRRVNNSVSFERNWHAYKTGFGSHEGNFWWGNDNLALALNDGRQYVLRVDMSDWADEHRYATYSGFSVAGESDNYRLHVGTYAGDAGDGLRSVDNMQFTTTDRDNDSHGTLNCATRFRGGSWFADCHSAHPNGPYHASSTSPYATGVIWSPWHGQYYSLKRIDMKFRATS